MGQRYLADSNFIINYTSGSLPASGCDFVEDILNKEFLLSVVVKIGVLGFDDVPDKLKGMEQFLNAGTDLPLDAARKNVFY